MKLKCKLLYFAIGSIFLSCSVSNAPITISKSQKENKRISQRSSSMKVDLYQLDTNLLNGDNTMIVQEAINQIGPNGGKIVIPPDIKFELKKLTFPSRIELEYYADSDISSDAGERKTTNEKVSFISNANEQGIVNEFIYQAPFHPGLVLNVRKDVIEVSKFLGKDQSLNNPVRVSTLIQDEGQTQLMEQYMSYPEFANPYSGWRLSMCRNIYKLKGVSLNDFSPPLKIGDFVSTADGAGGNYVRAGKNNIEVQWFSGRFKKGDQLIINNKPTKISVKDVEYSHQAFNSLSISKKTGYFGIGVPNDNALYPFTVGGKIGIQGTRQHGQYIMDENSEPALVFAPSFEAKNIEGLQIKLEGKNNWKRLSLTDVSEKKVISNLSGLRAHTSFNGYNLRPPYSSFNVRSIEKISPGTYRIYFITPVERNDYQIGLSTSKPLEYAYVKIKSTEYIEIEIVTTGTDKKTDPIGDISVICFGGEF